MAAAPELVTGNIPEGTVITFAPPDPLEAYKSGSTEPWTVEVLCALIRAKMPYTLVETGTFEGKTTRRFMEAMTSYAPRHGAHLWTVEGDKDRAEAASAMLTATMLPQGTAAQLVHADALAFLESVSAPMLDFVFLDDDHDAAHVRRELDVVLPKMRPGGIVAMHDVVGPFGLDRVCKSFGGIVLEFERLHIAGGLGLITA
jgi:predicted O-methyltransferase YrrM